MQICPECHIGKITLRKVPYIQWYDAGSIIVDRIPALICENCGEKSYDIQALENLHRLLWSRPDGRISSLRSR